MAGILLPFLLTSCAAEQADPPPYDPPAKDSSPAAAKQPWEEQTPAGSKAFVKHWIRVFNTTQTTLDTSALREISSKNCRTCNSWIKLIDKTEEAGGRIQGYEYTIEEISTLRGRNRFAMRLGSGKARIWPSRGAEPKSAKPQTVMTIGTARWSDGHWEMLQLNEVPQ